MGAIIQKIPLDYNVANDSSNYWDFQTCSTISSELWEKDTAVGFVAGLYDTALPCPNLATREICETQEQYDKFLKTYNTVFSPGDNTQILYRTWMYQQVAYAKAGWRCGIPYLPYSNGQVNLPPLRYRHAANYGGEVLGSALLAAHIYYVVGHKVSNDFCNKLFDEVIRTLTWNREKGEINLDTDFTKLIDDITKISHLLGVNLRKNYDLQLASELNVLQPVPNIQTQIHHGPVTNTIYIWGERGSQMQYAYPSAWNKWKGNLYGDGRKVDPYFAFVGMPRFHEEFENGVVSAKLGKTIEFNQPIDSLLKICMQFITNGYRNILLSSLESKKPVQNIVGWLAADNRWGMMEQWLSTYNRSILYYYFVDTSQHSNNLDYTSVMQALIFSHVAYWMVTPMTRGRQVRWKGHEKEYEKDLSDQEAIERDAETPKPNAPDFHWVGSKVIRQKALETQRMYDLKLAWRKSYIGFVDGDPWQNKIPQSQGIIYDDINQVSDLEYENLIYDFIREYPLPRPYMPDLYQRWHIDDPEVSGWIHASNKQWDYYIVWCEANVNARTKEGYIKPGEDFVLSDNSLDIITNMPINLGILSPFDGFEGVGKFFHWVTPVWSFIFGDEWWKFIVDEVLQIFEDVIKKLWQIAKKIGAAAAEALEQYKYYLLAAAGIISVGLLAYDFVDETVKERARNK